MSLAGTVPSNRSNGHGGSRRQRDGRRRTGESAFRRFGILSRAIVKSERVAE
jgi:hypothetical protein